MTTFLHGVETQELTKGPKAITQVVSAVVGIIGTAPIHHAESPAVVNSPVLVLTDRDNVQFGSGVSGYTIPDALAGVQAQGYGTSFVVNVFDPTKHKTDVPAADIDIVTGSIVLTHKDIVSCTVKAAGGAGNALTMGVDYKLDRKTGIITILTDGALKSAAKANVAYAYGNPSAITAADIIGAITEAGKRTGMQALLDCASLYGMSPKILIAPGFSSASSVQAALQVLAQKTKMRAVALVDAPSGAKMTQVLEGRGTSGTLELRLSDDRLFYCYPHLMAYDANTDSSAAVPFSPRLAGVIARTDSELGYWCSPSNKQILGVTGIETPLSASVSDATCDVNVLNGAGVVTVFTGYGVGIRTWGNRASTFPGSSAITTFMCVRRTIDMVDESIEKAALAYLDGPVGKVLIQAILDDVNAFLRTLISRGALMPGSRLEYFDADNEVSELAAGHVTFTKTFCPPPPLERLIYKSVLDTTLLGN